MDKGKVIVLAATALVSLAVGATGSAMVFGASAKPVPTVTVTALPQAEAGDIQAQVGDPSKPDTSHSAYEAPAEDYMSDPNATLPENSFDAVSDSSWPAAKNELELKFFKLAHAACKTLNDKGMKYIYADGYALVTADSDGLVRGNRFDSDGNWIESVSYEGGSSICDPDAVNSAATYADTFAGNFMLETTDEVEYIWHSHHGSRDLSNVSFYVREGKIVQVFESFDSYYSVRYGLNKLERASALKDY